MGFVLRRGSSARMIYIKRFLAFILVALLLMGIVVQPRRAKAVDLVITPAAALLVGTIMITCGLVIAGDANFRQAVNIAWNRATDNLKSDLLSISATLNSAGTTAVNFAGDKWSEITGWISGVFPADSTQLTLPNSLYDASEHWTIQMWNGSCIRHVSNGVVATQLLTVPAGATGTQNVSFAGYDVSIFYSNSSSVETTVTFHLANSHSIGAAICSYSGSPGGLDYQINVPIIDTYNGYDEMWFSTQSQYSTDPTFSGYYWVNTNDSYYYDGFLLHRDWGQVYYYNADNVQMNLGDPYEYNSIAQFVSDVLCNYGNVLPYSVDTDVYSKATSVPTTGNVTLSVPDTMAGGEALEPSAAADISDVSYPDAAVSEGESTLEMTHSDVQSLGNLMLTKFPFCIPWDFARAVGLLAAPAEAPHWTIDLFGPVAGMVGGWHGSTTVDIDFSQFSTLAAVCRWMETIIFCAGLAVGTKRLLWTA